MECSEEILVACLEPEPIGTLVGCLVPALPARWSCTIFVNKISVLCPLSIAHYVDVHYLCERTLGRIRQDE